MAQPPPFLKGWSKKRVYQREPQTQGTTAHELEDNGLADWRRQGLRPRKRYCRHNLLYQHEILGAKPIRHGGFPTIPSLLGLESLIATHFPRNPPEEITPSTRFTIAFLLKRPIVCRFLYPLNYALQQIQDNRLKTPFEIS